jgi:ligand-binding sensor domain-containing protein
MTALHTVPHRSGCFFALGLILLLSVPASAQPGTWQAHTSLRDVVVLDMMDDVLWAGTTGGVFSYRVADGEIQRFTPVQGLWSIDVRALAVDASRGLVWVGYGDGVIDRIDAETGHVRSVFDIERARQYSSRAIQDISIVGDSVLIATAFGAVILDPVRLEVRDSFDQFGSIPSGTAARAVFKAPDEQGSPRIWVATSRGLAHAPATGANLRERTNWTVETEGLLSTDIRDIAYFDGSVWLGTAADVWRRRGPSDFQRMDLGGRDVRRIRVAGDRLMVVDPVRISSIRADGTFGIHQVGTFVQPSDVVMSTDGRLWTSDRAEGVVAAAMPPLASPTIEPLQVFFPPSPYHGNFSELRAGADGSIWAVSGVVAAGTGIYRLDAETGWRSFLARTDSELSGKGSYFRIHIASDGTGYVGTHGAGLSRIQPDGVISWFDASNSSLATFSGLNNYVVVGGISTGPDGTLWVANTGSTTPLHSRRPDGTWEAFPPFTGGGLSAGNNAYDRVFVDSFGQLWIIVLDERNLQRMRGLLVAEATSGGARPQAFRFFGEEGGLGQGLPGTQVSSVVEDHSGRIWIGTEKGLSYIINQGITARDPNAVPIWPQQTDLNFLLYGLKINALAVDPANRLWIGSDDGLRLVRDTGAGFEIVQHFDRSNSPLFSNVVRSLAIDARSGQVFVATDVGTLSFGSDAIEGVASAGNLRVYPNPVRPGLNEAVPVFIEGLVDATDIRILTPAGELVASFAARGGRVQWDGRDRFGQPVGSGIYLIVAVGQNGEGTSHGKVAVIR